MREALNVEHIGGRIIVFGCGHDAFLDAVSFCKVTCAIDSTIDVHQNKHAPFPMLALCKLFEFLCLSWASLAPRREEVHHKNLACWAQCQKRCRSGAATALGHLHIKIWCCGADDILGRHDFSSRAEKKTG